MLASAQATKYVRFEAAGRAAWGILQSETTIQELQGSVFEGANPTGRTLKLAEEAGLGARDLKRIEVIGTPIREAVFDFAAIRAKRRNAPRVRMGIRG